MKRKAAEPMDGPVEWDCPETGQALRLVRGGGQVELALSGVGYLRGQVLYSVSTIDGARQVDTCWRVLRPVFIRDRPEWRGRLLVLRSEADLSAPRKALSYWSAPESLVGPTGRLGPGSSRRFVERFLLDGLAAPISLAGRRPGEQLWPEREVRPDLRLCGGLEVLPGARALLEAAARARASTLLDLGGNFDPSPSGWARGVQLTEHHAGPELASGRTVVMAEVHRPCWRVAHRAGLAPHQGVVVLELVGEDLCDEEVRWGENDVLPAEPHVVRSWFVPDRLGGQREAWLEGHLPGVELEPYQPPAGPLAPRLVQLDSGPDDIDF